MERCMPRGVVIFLLLAIIGFILLVCSVTSIEKLSGHRILGLILIQKNTHSSFELTKNLSHPEVTYTFCPHLGQKPTTEESIEEQYLLNLTAWPGPLVQGLPVKHSSSPAKSYFVIQGSAKQRVGGQLVVEVHVRNFFGLPKKHGGDFLIARLHSPKLKAGVAGKMHDHHDGNYTVLFPLLWAGEVQVQITMVHPSEAMVVLKRLQKEHADRVFYRSDFRSGAISDSTECNVCLPFNRKPLCNYTDPITGEPWYCYKPKKLECDTRIYHSRNGERANLATTYEKQFFKIGKNMKVPVLPSVMDKVLVLPAEKGQLNLNYTTAGYYYEDSWRPLNGAVMRQFNDSAAVKKCLKGKMVHMFGDSTIRQWFEYLSAFVPEFNIHSPTKAGPFMAVDSENSILIHYSPHGPPIRWRPVFTTNLHYVANELDRIQGGKNTVVILGLWAHFNTFPIEMYIRRLRHIRKAVVRLLKREPATLVVIRTPNLKEVTERSVMYGSDWFSLQLDTVLRPMFRGLNVQLLDAWEMTVAHYLPHDLHPPPIIIKNMIDLILSLIC